MSKSADDTDDRFAVTDPVTGERLYHYEWNGWLWCEREMKAFEWDTGEVECPHCGETLEIPEPIEDDEDEPPEALVASFSDKELAEMGYESWSRPVEDTDGGDDDGRNC